MSSLVIDDPSAFARQVALATREGVSAYIDACALLSSALAGEPRAQRQALRELNETAQTLGLALVSLARTLEELGPESKQFDPAEDPRLALGLVRTVGESMVLMQGRSLAELPLRPLADPTTVTAMAARPGLSAFLALAGGAA